MKPFQFRLERLKRVRSAQERAAKADFGTALSELTAAESSHQRSLERRDSAREELRHVMEAGRNAGAYLAAQRVTDRFDSLVHTAKAIVSQAVTAVEGKRKEWIAVRSEEEGLERLRLSHQAEHRRETERELARELDEVAMSRTAASGKPVSKTLAARESAS